MQDQYIPIKHRNTFDLIHTTEWGNPCCVGCGWRLRMVSDDGSVLEDSHDIGCEYIRHRAE